MFGQTNCWIHPDIEYIAHKVNLEKAGGEQVFVSTRRSARNMSYQGFTAENGKVDVLTPVKGEVNIARVICALSVGFFEVLALIPQLLCSLWFIRM